jgi:hypothetical protein
MKKLTRMELEIVARNHANRLSGTCFIKPIAENEIGITYRLYEYPDHTIGYIALAYTGERIG